jgi:hypothetical protein
MPYVVRIYWSHEQVPLDLAYTTEDSMLQTIENLRISMGQNAILSFDFNTVDGPIFKYIIDCTKISYITTGFIKG